MTGEWRTHKSHAAETAAVKAALVAAGYKGVRVGHGTGTAWDWLHLKVSVPKPAGCRCEELQRACKPCRDAWCRAYEAVCRLALEVTGRRDEGEWGGRINADIDFVARRKEVTA